MATQTSGDGGKNISQHDQEGSFPIEVEASQEKSNSIDTQPERESQPPPSQAQLQTPIAEVKKSTQETDNTPPGKGDAEGKTDPTKPMEPCEKSQMKPCPSIAPKETMPVVQASKPVISKELEQSLIDLTKALPKYKLDLSENLDKKLDRYIGELFEKMEVSWWTLIFSVVIGPLLVAAIIAFIKRKYFPDESLQDFIKSLFCIYITVMVSLVILCVFVYFFLSWAQGSTPGVCTGPDEVRLSLPDDISKPLKKFLETSHSDGTGKENMLKVSEKLEKALIKIAESKDANRGGTGKTTPTTPVSGQGDGSTATTSVTGKEDGSSVMLWFILLAYWVVGALCLRPALQDYLKAFIVNTLIVFAFLMLYWVSTTSGPMLYMAVLLLFLLPFYFKLI